MCAETITLQVQSSQKSDHLPSRLRIDSLYSTLVVPNKPCSFPKILYFVYHSQLSVADSMLGLRRHRLHEVGSAKASRPRYSKQGNALPVRLRIRHTFIVANHQVTTPPTKGLPKDTHAHIAWTLEATLRVGTTSRDYNRWHQAFCANA